MRLKVPKCCPLQTLTCDNTLPQCGVVLGDHTSICLLIELATGCSLRVLLDYLVNAYTLLYVCSSAAPLCNFYASIIIDFYKKKILFVLLLNCVPAQLHLIVLIEEQWGLIQSNVELLAI